MLAVKAHLSCNLFVYSCLSENQFRRLGTVLAFGGTVTAFKPYFMSKNSRVVPVPSVATAVCDVFATACYSTSLFLTHVARLFPTSFVKALDGRGVWALIYVSPQEKN